MKKKMKIAQKYSCNVGFTRSFFSKAKRQERSSNRFSSLLLASRKAPASFAAFKI